MSSSVLTSLVPQLNGENYPFWSKQMRAYLMQQGKWDIIKDQLEHTKTDSFTASVVQNDGSTLSVTKTILLNGDTVGRLDQDYIEQKLMVKDGWTARDSEVQGSILLRCIPAISDKLSDEECAFDMWARLLYEFGTPGTAGIYNVFQQFLNTQVPSKGNPVQAIERIEQHVRRLKELNVTIPPFIHTMVLLSKLPPYMKFVSQFAQNMAVDELSAEDIKARALNAYQAEFGAPKTSKTDSASKITAVRRNNGNPSFSQQRRGGKQQQQQRQQQQSSSNDSDARGEDNGRGKRRRGRGRGRGRGGYNGSREAHDDYEGNHFLSNMASETRVLGPEDRSSPYSLKSVQGGPLHKASPTTFHPSMRRASKLAADIGVRGTAETLRVLERVVPHLRDDAGPSSATIEEVDDDDSDEDDVEDERASKRFRSTPLIDRIDTAANSEDDFIPEDTPIDGMSFGDDEDVNEEIAQCAGLQHDESDHEFC
ncbi:hypothetical protein PENSPDRAFT_681120 [Peniophora sp. CONT]|nr:hypothetical protein PENSPDRAFT_681120 [Peniophora sp. CONT]